MAVNKGSTAITQVKHGEIDIQSIRLGDQALWTRPGTIRDDFGPLGALEHWIQELIDALEGLNLGQTLGQLLGGLLYGLPFGLGTILPVATITGYVTAAADWVVGLLVTGLGALGNFIGFLDDVLTGAVNFVFGVHDEALSVVNFIIGSLGNVARMILPDAVTQMPTQVAHYRYEDNLLYDDGYLEVMAADIGAAGNFATQIYRRYSGDGQGTNGVGIDLRASTASIVARVASTATLVVNCGSFFAGDVLRLVQSGNLHSLYRNGEFVGEWNDSGATVEQGAGYRSVGLVMMAGKELLGPHQYSPALAYVEAA